MPTISTRTEGQRVVRDACMQRTCGNAPFPLALANGGKTDSQLAIASISWIIDIVAYKFGVGTDLVLTL